MATAKKENVEEALQLLKEELTPNENFSETTKSLVKPWIENFQQFSNSMKARSGEVADYAETQATNIHNDATKRPWVYVAGAAVVSAGITALLMRKKK